MPSGRAAGWGGDGGGQAWPPGPLTKQGPGWWGRSSAQVSTADGPPWKDSYGTRPPPGPVLMGSGPLLRLAIAPRVGGSGTSGPGVRLACSRLEGHSCLCVPPSWPCGSSSLLPILGPRCAQFGLYLVILSCESVSDPASVPYARRGMSSAKKSSWPEASTSTGQGEDGQGESK